MFVCLFVCLFFFIRDYELDTAQTQAQDWRYDNTGGEVTAVAVTAAQAAMIIYRHGGEYREHTQNKALVSTVGPHMVRVVTHWIEWP